jgi:hypothetical protein
LNRANTTVEREEPRFTERAYDYILYGLRLRSQLKLTLEEAASPGGADLELSPAEPRWMEAKISAVELGTSDWVNICELPDGWSYARYDGMFDFLISPSGDCIRYRMLANVPLESFEAYALGRIFSFALVKKGFEPLHAATVVVGQRAVAFLGASTFGKSSLAACFVAEGYPLLTDDVLRLEEQKDGRYLAFPGPARLKLLPRIARLFIGDSSVRVPINLRHPHPKRVYPLTSAQSCATPVPLAAIYAVTAPRKVYRKQRIAVSALPSVDALVKVLSFTHNHQLTGRERLVRQFDAARRLIDKVPVRSLSYPRSLECLPDVRSAILADLG